MNSFRSSNLFILSLILYYIYCVDKCKNKLKHLKFFYNKMHLFTFYSGFYLGSMNIAIANIAIKIG
jgi:hypothetical protein